LNCIRAAGNTALRGAKQALHAGYQAEAILPRVQFIALADNPDFEERFVAAMWLTES